MEYQDFKNKSEELNKKSQNDSFSDPGITIITANLQPVQSGINFGSPTNKFGTFYGSVVACPLPTVENPLLILNQIPEPIVVGERGHYGDGKYFDNKTFPQELLWADSNGWPDIEHTKMIGFLLQTVIELHKKIKVLEEQVS